MARASDRVVDVLVACSLSALSSANASVSARASSILFWASSFFLKSSSLPVMLAFHQAMPGGDVERPHRGLVAGDELLGPLGGLGAGDGASRDAATRSNGGDDGRGAGREQTCMETNSLVPRSCEASRANGLRSNTPIFRATGPAATAAPATDPRCRRTRSPAAASSTTSPKIDRLTAACTRSGVGLRIAATTRARRPRTRTRPAGTGTAASWCPAARAWPRPGRASAATSMTSAARDQDLRVAALLFGAGEPGHADDVHPDGQRPGEVA